MIGIVVTGHGAFASGMVGSFRMIAGNQEHVCELAFEEGENLQAFDDKIRQTVQGAIDKYGQVIVLTDLKGGTPFNHVMLEYSEHPAVKVLAGTNLSMLLEGAMSALGSDDLEGIVQKMVTIGRESVQDCALSSESDDTENGEGI